MKRFIFVVKEKIGIHARPASQLVRKAAAYKSAITIEKDGKSADVKRLIALMALGVQCGEKVTFMIEGEDEEIAAVQLEEYCNHNL
ncbi:MAG TPA: HPr family phosphocarrier protein [Lachnospiraceae bacterium]|nr:HPr family phosphocarrier protein [Lachnospiraceae bacterium]